MCGVFTSPCVVGMYSAMLIRPLIGGDELDYASFHKMCRRHPQALSEFTIINLVDPFCADNTSPSNSPKQAPVRSPDSPPVCNPVAILRPNCASNGRSRSSTSIKLHDGNGALMVDLTKHVRRMKSDLSLMFRGKRAKSLSRGCFSSPTFSCTQQQLPRGSGSGSPDTNFALT